jgi:hypothetical membrane protein
VPSRAAALAGIAAPLSFISAWAVGGARAKDYSPVQDFISDLARVGAPTRPLMTAGFVGFGLLAPVWARTLPTRALRTSVTVAGAGTLAVAALPLGASWGDAPHAVAAGFSYVAMASTPLLGAQVLEGRAAALSRATGAASGLMLAGSMLGRYDGLLQRAGLGVVDAWFVVMAVRQLRR